MATILIASIPVPAHTRNALPFAQRLVEAGHEVLWYAGEGFHGLVRRAGATPLPFRRTTDPTGPDATTAVVDLAGLRAVRDTYERVFVGQLRNRFEDVRDILDRTGVDVVLTDTLSYGVGWAAQSRSVPWATFGDGPLGFAEPDTPPFGTGLAPLPGPAGQRRNRVVTRVARGVIFAGAEQAHARAHAQLGLPGVPGSIFEDNVSPLLHLHGATPGFEYPREALPGHVHWVGALRPGPTAGWSPPDWWQAVATATDPVVLVSQGTIRPDVGELLLPTVRALADRPVVLVVTTGMARPESVLDRLPGAGSTADIRVAAFIPYDALLPHVDVFVTNGGYTGVTLALAHGVPIVQAGSSEEKADVGARIAWSGVGVRIRRTRPRPGAIRDAVGKVLSDPSYRAAADRVRREMAGHDAGAEGAALLLQLAHTRRPVLRPVASDVG